MITTMGALATYSAEAAGHATANILFLVVGVLLVAFGFRRLGKRKQALAEGNEQDMPGRGSSIIMVVAGVLMMVALLGTLGQATS